jgi:hypothetical protein
MNLLRPKFTDKILKHVNRELIKITFYCKPRIVFITCMYVNKFLPMIFADNLICFFKIKNVTIIFSAQNGVS